MNLYSNRAAQHVPAILILSNNMLCVPETVVVEHHEMANEFAGVCVVRFEIRNIPKHCYGLHVTDSICICWMCPVCLVSLLPLALTLACVRVPYAKIQSHSNL